MFGRSSVPKRAGLEVQHVQPPFKCDLKLTSRHIPSRVDTLAQVLVIATVSFTKSRIVFAWYPRGRAGPYQILTSAPKFAALVQIYQTRSWFQGKY